MGREVLRKYLNRTEHSLQKEIVCLLKLARVFCFETDVMDGLKFCNTERARLSFITHHKNMGYVNGQSDLIVLLQNRIVFVELKNGNVGRQSEHQKFFQNEVEKRGFEYQIWRNIQDCEDFLKKIT